MLQNLLLKEFHSIHVILVGALIICAVGDELTVAHPPELVTKSALLTMLLGPIVYLASNSVYKWFTCQVVSWSHLVAIAVMVLLIPFAHHFNLLQLNATVTSMFILIVIYETIKDSRIKSRRRV